MKDGLRSLKRLLLTGLFVVAPFSLTFILLVWFVGTVDALLAPVTSLLGRPVPGLGLVAALLIVLAVGALASNIVGQHLLEYFEELLLRVPGINWLYKTIKQLAEVFSPTSRDAFRSVVLVELRPQTYSMGFVTNELTLEQGGAGRKMLCVYVPTNHFYFGDFMLVPAEKVLQLPMTLQEGLQCAISAGASYPPVLKPRAPSEQ